MLESLNSELSGIWANACRRLEKHEYRQCYLRFSYFERINSIQSFIEQLLSLRHCVRGQACSSAHGHTERMKTQSLYIQRDET